MAVKKLDHQNTKGVENMEDLKEGLVIPGFLFVDEPYKALPLTAKVVLGLLIGRIRPDEEAAGEAVACIKQDDVGAILNISRPTYRRALQCLAACGLIEVVSGNRGSVNKIRFPMYQNFPLNVSKLSATCIKTFHDMYQNFPRTQARADEETEQAREAEKKSSRKRGKRFVPPTVHDVRAYCNESGHYIDADAFIDFYTSKGWKVGKNPMKDWKAAVRTWAKRDGNSQGNRRPMNGNERLKQSDDELERMCRAYDSRNSATSVDDPTRKLPQ